MSAAADERREAPGRGKIEEERASLFDLHPLSSIPVIPTPTTPRTAPGS
jgi:hypothetical protein